MSVGSAAEKWRRRIAEQERSGQSIQAYCERQGWASSSFHYWKRRLHDETERFVPIGVVDSRPTMTIAGPDGWTLHVPCEEQTLRLVLRILDERRC